VLSVVCGCLVVMWTVFTVYLVFTRCLMFNYDYNIAVHIIQTYSVFRNCFQWIFPLFVSCLQVAESCHNDGCNEVSETDAVEAAGLGIVYDLFLAQICSTLTCPVCRKHSCKMDPLLLVPLPLSEKYRMPVFATVVRRHTAPPLLQVATLLSTCDMVSDLRSRIAVQSHTAAEQV